MFGLSILYFLITYTYEITGQKPLISCQACSLNLKVFLLAACTFDHSGFVVSHVYNYHKITLEHTSYGVLSIRKVMSGFNLEVGRNKWNGKLTHPQTKNLIFTRLVYRDSAFSDETKLYQEDAVVIYLNLFERLDYPRRVLLKRIQL